MAVSWVDINDMEGYYQVSSTGLVRSCERSVLRSDGTVQPYKSQLIKGSLDKDGYRRYSLVKDKKKYYFRLHQLVASHFIGIIPYKMVVAHIDGDVTNNNVSNLKICTQKENINDKNIHNTMAKGSKHGRSVLSEQDIPIIRTMLKERMSAAAIARAIGVGVWNIHNVKDGRTWTHV